MFSFFSTDDKYPYSFGLFSSTYVIAHGQGLLHFTMWTNAVHINIFLWGKEAIDKYYLEVFLAKTDNTWMWMYI